jgi:hypothetical protein
MEKIMGVMILDAGSSIIKAKTVNREVVFPHAIQPLTEGEYQKITSRASINGNSADYIRVNGKPYVVAKLRDTAYLFKGQALSDTRVIITAFWPWLPYLMSMSVDGKTPSLAAMRLVM